MRCSMFLGVLNWLPGPFSILAIFIASMGLFGISAFTAELRTKEIGIRKTFGANLPLVIRLISKEFLVYVALALTVALPVGWYFMNSWLQNFVYRIDISIVTFILAGVLILFIAFITVSRQAIKAATANPVESLHYE